MHILSIIVAAVVNFLVGGFWYSKYAFGKPWAELIGKKPDELTSPAIAMGGMAVLALILSWVMSMIITANNVASLPGLVVLIAVIWVGLVLPFTLTDVLFAGKPIKLFLINAGNQLVSLLVMGIVFILLPH